MCVCLYMGFPGGAVLKKPPAQQDTPVRSLGREDPLEEEMATHSSILAWKISWTEEPGISPQACKESMGLQRVRHDWAPITFFLSILTGMRQYTSLQF